MTVLASNEDFIRVRECGKILKEVFVRIKPRVLPGVKTCELDAEIEEIIRSYGAEPAFKGYKGYPATICASRNEVVVHGIPSEKVVLCDGDIIGIDVGVKKNGFFTDAARTFIVGKASLEAENLVRITELCLKEGIKKAIAGNRVSDISHVIQEGACLAGFEEVRFFVGHGIGTKLHEPPEVPNWVDRRSKNVLLKEGLLLAIEPMLNAGTRDVKVLSDGWTAVTSDGRLSAHFEDTIIVGKKEAEIVT